MSGELDFTVAGALKRLLDALDAYDDLEQDSVDELNDAEVYARAVLAADAVTDQRAREALLGSAI